MTSGETLRRAVRFYRRWQLIAGILLVILLVAFLQYLYSYLAEFAGGESNVFLFAGVAARYVATVDVIVADDPQSELETRGNECTTAVCPVRFRASCPTQT